MLIGIILWVECHNHEWLLEIKSYCNLQNYIRLHKLVSWGEKNWICLEGNGGVGEMGCYFWIRALVLDVVRQFVSYPEWVLERWKGVDVVWGFKFNLMPDKYYYLIIVSPFQSFLYTFFCGKVLVYNFFKISCFFRKVKEYIF